jgi:hypothetical protein
MTLLQEEKVQLLKSRYNAAGTDVVAGEKVFLPSGWISLVLTNSAGKRMCQFGIDPNGRSHS